MSLKKLLVIGQVDILEDGGITRSRGFDVRLNEKSKLFEKIYYVGPSNNYLKLFERSKNNIRLFGVGVYGKGILKKLTFIFFSLYYNILLYSIIKKIQPEIVELRVPSIYVLYFYPLVRFIINKPIVLYVSGDWGGSFEHNYNVPFKSVIARFLDYAQKPLIQNSIVITAGTKLKEKYSKYNEVHAYMSTTHNNINRDRKFSFEGNLLVVGRLEALKRVEDAIDALYVLNIENGWNFHLDIVGEGNRKDFLIKKCSDYGLTDSVTFQGYISDETKLRNIYLKADVLIFPSLSEGSPKVLPEAMSNGVVPVCVKTTGSNSKIINNGINGFLVDPKSPEQIVRKIAQIKDMSEIDIIKLRENCYKYAFENTLEKEQVKSFNFIKEKVGF